MKLFEDIPPLRPEADSPAKIDWACCEYWPLGVQIEMTSSSSASNIASSEACPNRPPTFDCQVLQQDHRP